MVQPAKYIDFLSGLVVHQSLQLSSAHSWVLTASVVPIHGCLQL